MNRHMPADDRDAYLVDHHWLADPVLLGIPARGPLTPLTLFVCTYVAKLANLHISFETLALKLCENLHGCVLVINSNFGHAAQPGYEGYMKEPKPIPKTRAPTRGRARKVQGDGTSFNSAIEPIIAVDYPGMRGDKIY